MGASDQASHLLATKCDWPASWVPLWCRPGKSMLLKRLSVMYASAAAKAVVRVGADGPVGAGEERVCNGGNGAGEELAGGRRGL